MKTLLTSILLVILFTSCSKNINYTAEHIKQTSGRYLYNQDEVIEVFYENNDLYIRWKAGKMKPVVLDENTFFVPDMYQKLRFITQPNTKDRYLGVVSEEDESKVEYTYKKVADTHKTARMYWRDKQYKEAAESYLALHRQDSTKSLIREHEVNNTGYKLLNTKDFDNAITVFEMNTVLYPESDNAYDSLGEAFLGKGDSLQAYNNFKKSLELNSGNKRAKEFVNAYEKE
ncbi:MAG: tetratricopeptide repeat protein [Aquaticitalea sp.]